jgi:Icc-related predicted phosphoesterase
MTVIDLISDLHGHYPELEGGDLLIVAGDLTARDHLANDWLKFEKWIRNQKYREKVVIAGNHDNTLQSNGHTLIYNDWKQFTGVTYLCDSGTEFEGLKIWGSPWTKTFEGMNPKCKAFTVDTEEELAIKFSLIPEDTDILITHSPPFGILDAIPLEDGTSFHVGSTALRNTIWHSKAPLKLHVFGHIHECGGRSFETSLTKFVNASYVNEKYKPVNKPIRVIL